MFYKYTTYSTKHITSLAQSQYLYLNAPAYSLILQNIGQKTNFIFVKHIGRKPVDTATLLQHIVHLPYRLDVSYLQSLACKNQIPPLPYL